MKRPSLHPTHFRPNPKHPYRSVLLVCVVIFGLLTQAQGQATFTTSGTSGQQTTTFAGANTVDFELPATSSATGTYTYTGTLLNGNANFSNLGNATNNNFTTSTTNAPTGDTTRYLVIGSAGATTSTTVTFTGRVTYMGFLWGTPNGTDNVFTLNYLFNNTPGSVTYNASTVIGTGTSGATFGGSNSTNGTTEFVNFFAQPGYTFTGATFSDTAGTSFQIDNLAYAVPEPATWLGGGLAVSLGFWAVRRRLVPGL